MFLLLLLHLLRLLLLLLLFQLFLIFCLISFIYRLSERLTDTTGFNSTQGCSGKIHTNSCVTCAWCVRYHVHISHRGSQTRVLPEKKNFKLRIEIAFRDSIELRRYFSWIFFKYAKTQTSEAAIFYFAQLPGRFTVT